MPTKRCNMTREQKDKANAIKHRWALKNREKVIAYKRAHYHANRDKYLIDIYLRTCREVA